MDIKYDIELTPQERQDLFVTAVEGGINYWCMPTSVKSSKDGMWANVTLDDREVAEDANPDLKVDGAPAGLFTIDDWVMQMGLDRLSKSKYQHHVVVVVNENYDATTADVIVQMALFGEILYG